MAMITSRNVSFKHAAAPAGKRTRVVKVAAVQQKTGSNIGSAFAAAAAAMLLVRMCVLLTNVLCGGGLMCVLGPV